MDAVTHVLAGYVVGWAAAAFARRRGLDPRHWPAVGAAAAFAPDLDVLFVPLAWSPSLYPFQHRGASHSLLGAPLMALGAVWALGRWGRRWHRLRPFTWHRALLVPVLLGAWSHLLLDTLTHQGAPLLWPFSLQRTSLEIYYWIIWWLAPFSLLPLVMRFRDRWDDRRVMQAAAVIAVVVLIVGGVRWSAKPDGEDVFATRDPWAWAVATEHPNGTVQMELVKRGRVLEVAWYARDVPDGAQDAVDRTLATDHYRAFRFASTAPHVVQAEPRADGWNVTVVDTVQRFDADAGSDWRPRSWRQDAGLLRATVDSDGVRVERSWRT